jgi:hypothetical protein
MYWRKSVRSIVVCAVLATLTAGFVRAAEPDEEAGQDAPELSFALDLTYNGKYVWRGINTVDGAVFQPSATVAYGGLSFNVWGNMDLDDVNGQSGDFTEYDLTLDYSWTWDPVDLSVGTIYYTFPHSGDAPSTIEVYAGASLDVPLSPGITVYNDIHMADGAYISLSAGHALEDIWTPVEGVSVSAALDASVAYGTSNYNAFYYGEDSNAWTDALVSLSFPVSLGEHFSITPALNYSSLLDSDIRSNLSDDTNLWGGITLSCTF